MHLWQKPLKYNVFIVVGLLAFSFGLKAQNSKAQFSATVSIGPSIPVGNFANKNIDSTAAHGAANIGPAIQLSVNYRFPNSIFGFEISGAWQENNRDDQAFGKYIRNGFPASGNYEWVADGKTWTVWKILAGPTWTLAVSADKKTLFEGGISGGILKTSVPGFFYTIRGTDSMMNYLQSGTNTARPLPTSFCYQLSAGLAHRISSNILITGNVRFSHATVTDEYTYYWFGNYPSTPMEIHYKEEIPISTLNILFGVRYEF